MVHLLHPQSIYKSGCIFLSFLYISKSTVYLYIDGTFIKSTKLRDASRECNNLFNRRQTISDYICVRVMNTSSSSDAVVRLTNVVASAIAQFQAGQQYPAQSDQSNLLPGSSSNIRLSQPSNTSSLALNQPLQLTQEPSNVSKLVLISALMHVNKYIPYVGKF